MRSLGRWVPSRMRKRHAPMEPLTTRFDTALTHARKVYERDGDWEAVLAWLRAEGFGQAKACLATCRVLDVDLNEAKRIVTFSPTWEDRLESNAALEEALVAALEQSADAPSPDIPQRPRRYWIEFDYGDWFGPPGPVRIGVTSETVEDALTQIADRWFDGGSPPPIERLIEDVDVNQLIDDGEFPASDSRGHPVYGVPASPGIWYPWDQTETH